MPAFNDDTTLATATEDVSLPLLLPPDELHLSWVIDGASGRTSSPTMGLNSTSRILSVLPSSPLALPQLQYSTVSGDAETSSDTDSIITDATAQVRRRSTDHGNHRRPSSFRKSKSHHYAAKSDKAVGRNASPPTKRKTGRLRHNEVEKRYRNSLNFELRRLQMVVPYLANSDECRVPSPTKATIIASAVQYIKAIEAERDALRVGVGAARSFDWVSA
jgi:hypothetical protein